MFVGRFPRQLDEKGRLAIPADFVQLLGEGERDAMFVAPGAKGCIWLLPKSRYEWMVDLLADSPDDEARDLFFHYSQRKRLDKAGRVLLDDDALAFAGIEREDGVRPRVVICGTGRYMEVWEEESYKARTKGPRQFAQDLRKLTRAAERRAPEVGR